MHAVISQLRVDIYEAHALPKDKWESLLNELKAEHVPGCTPDGKRMVVVVTAEGSMIATIYRTSELQNDDIAKILKRYEISTG